jgi:hypothetical protein
MATNQELLEHVALALRTLSFKNVFVGGATTHLLISDPSAPGVSPTTDVDIVIDVSSPVAFAVQLRDELRRLGLKEDTSEGAPLCRWRVGGVTVDIMSPNADVLGFSNRWYPTALAHCQTTTVGGVDIQVIDAVSFLATKIEAYGDRGKGDFLASKDIEDIIAVLDGRPELTEELTSREPEVLQFISQHLAEWIDLDDFNYAAEGYLRADEQRVPLFRERVQAILTACQKWQ